MSSNRLRYADDGQDEFDWLHKQMPEITDQFRSRVAQLLSNHLDSVIVEKDCTHHPPPISNQSQSGGVRLLADGPLVTHVTDTPANQQPASQNSAVARRICGTKLQKRQYELKRRAVDDSDTISSPKCHQVANNSSHPPSTVLNRSDSESELSSDSESMSKFAEAAVPEEFMHALRGSKTVHLDRR